MEKNIDCDESIPNSLLNQLEFWKKDMQFISDINIPKWFGFEKQLRSLWRCSIYELLF